MLQSYIMVFFISMVPLIELRGAIPYSQVMGLPLLESYIIAIIGNMLPVPIIYLFARKVLEWGADKPVIGGFFTWCLEKGKHVRARGPVRWQPAFSTSTSNPVSSQSWEAYFLPESLWDWPVWAFWERLILLFFKAGPQGPGRRNSYGTEE